MVAAGAWSTRLCREIGRDPARAAEDIDTVLVTRPPALAAPHMTVIDNVQGTYFRPESDVLTIVGRARARSGTSIPTARRRAPPGGPGRRRAAPHARIPAMERRDPGAGFRAFDGYSDDGHAILDRVEGHRGLYLATAFSGMGFKIAPAVGTAWRS